MKKTRKKRRPGGRSSKAKGSAFERKICRLLSLWVTGGTDDSLFWRSSQSGGRATSRKKAGKDLANQAGDICAIDPAGFGFTNTFFVECKCYRTLKLDSLFYPIKGVLLPMWAKCREQAAMYGKVPLMIVCENQRPPLVVLDAKYTVPIIANFPAQCLSVYFLDDFLATDPNIFIQGGSDAGDHNRGLASDKPKRRRVSLQVA
jgi:hypothetical protein